MLEATLTAGFIGSLALIVIGLSVTNSRTWHARRHARRGIRMIVGCDHCAREDMQVK